MRPLPVRPAPVHRETTGSYLARLADANRLKPATLPTLLGVNPVARDGDPGQPWPSSAVSALADLTSRSATALLAALPALGPGPVPPHQQTPGDSHLRPACRSCMTARGITGLVIQHTAPHEHVCLRHHRWLAAAQQYNLDQLPDVLTANRRHRRLARRATTTITTAHLTAQATTNAWFTTTADPDLHERWTRRLETLADEPFGHPHHPSTQRVELAVYPETVILTALHASAARRGQEVLYADQLRRLGLAIQDPGPRDPLQGPR